RKSGDLREGVKPAEKEDLRGALYSRTRAMATPESYETYRFRGFELDVAAYELRRDGQPVRLERQPMDLLILLVERRRQLVSRSDIVARPWAKDVSVDGETGTKTATPRYTQP